MTRLQALPLDAFIPDPDIRERFCTTIRAPASAGFTPIPADQFASYAEPLRVKIAWTLEAEPLGPAITRFAHETPAVATDAEARIRFRRYWRWARFGIVTIRVLLMPAVRREAERQWCAHERSRRR